MIYIVLFSVVILGGLTAYYIKDLNKQYVHFLLSFSGAYLLSIIVFHLLPEIYAENSTKNVGAFILFGILFQLLLEAFSHGAEHGHEHAFHKKTPWLVFISLAIHAFIEGLPINSNHQLHESYFYAILVHKLPISIILTGLMLSAGYSLKKIMMLLFIFASATPVAAFLGNQVNLLSSYAPYINGFVVGILAHVGTTILFENDHTHQLKIRKFAVIILAMILAYIA